jgi:hypothetical protein
MYINDAAIMLPSADLWMLTWLNSHLMWYYVFHKLPHKKDEAVAMDIVQVEALPIIQPTAEIRGEGETNAARLVTLTNERRGKANELLGWLKTEFEIENPGQRLENFTNLNEETFVEAVRDRRPRGAARLSPVALRDLRETFAAYSGQVRVLSSEADTLEQRLSDLVNVAYGLTPAEIDLMWRTAPPRMPIKPLG